MPLLIISLMMNACEARPALHISQQEAAAIGKQVFKNECNEQELCLTSWNNRESFASLGIGHFIWYPEGNPQPFKESFPDFVAFVIENGGGDKLPAWVKTTKHCPWRSRHEFRTARYKPRLNELRDYLNQQRGMQIRFMLHRATAALPKLEAQVVFQQRKHIRQQIALLKQSAAGRYALVDYINFKGEGIKVSERYNNQGWGLLQVLLQMKAVTEHDAPAAFSKSAAQMLTRRVHNAQKMGKDESNWLPGWVKRTDTYRTFFVPTVK